MSLLTTIFLLVFYTQLVTWIGKSVLSDIVRAIPFAIITGGEIRMRP